jgi:ABC-type amino acid transport substrate-binding protein
MTITVGADPFPPYQFETDRGVAGMDYDLVRESFALSGITINVVIKNWPLIESDYDRGDVRALFQVQPNEARMRSNLFSRELRSAVTEIITAERTSTVSTMQAFESDYQLAALEGYSYGDEIDRLGEDRKRRYPTQETLLRAIADGTEQYGVFDQGVRMYMQKQLGIDSLRAVPGLEFMRPLAVMFHKDDNTLRDAFDHGLKTIRENGRYAAIVDRWS